MPPASIRCPNCGHVLAAIEIPVVPHDLKRTPGDTSAPLLLRITEAAKLLSVSRSTLYQLVAKGDVKVVRIGRSVRIARAELERIALGVQAPIPKY